MAQPPQTPRQLLELKGGMNTLLPPDLIPEGSYAYLQNVRRLLGGRIVARIPLGNDLLGSALSAGPNSVTQLNDPYISGSPKWVYVEGTPAGNAYVSVPAGANTHVASGLSGNPVSYLPYRPSASPQPWLYASDPTATGVSLLNPSYGSYTGPLSGMFKMRSDGTTYKTGIMEPQIAPTFGAMPPTSGPYQVIYRYTYRSGNAQVTGATGATSNPSPESVPRWAGSSTSVPVAGVSNLTPTQYQNYIAGGGGGGIMNGQWSSEYGGFNQFRTRDLWGNNSYLLSPIQTQNMSDSGDGSAAYPIPDNATVTGIQFQLNWLNQTNGALGTLVNCQLAYNGNLIGIQKTPNASSTDVDPGGVFNAGTLIGGQNDPWGASLSASIVNDPSFGVNFQILQGQNTGSGNQLFINVVYVVVYWTVPALPIDLTKSTDPQVDTIDIYRMGGALENFTYVGSTPNTGSPPTFTDTLTDAVAALNPVLEFDNYEPFPSIDLPRAGVVNVAANGAITWVSGDVFNIRWLPGTIVLIAGVAYLMYNRPTDNHHMLVYTSTTSSDGIITFGYPPTGSNISYQIAEPDIAAEPSPVIWGPTPENAGSFQFGLDPLNPGYLVWSKGNNFDSAPDTNRQEICAPSEALQNGTITSELATVFSTERFWLIYPNFSNAIAAVTGTLGQQWIPIQAAATRGLYMRYAIAALGSSIAWRAKDGIYLSKGGGPEQELSGAIYNLFPHGEPEGPQPVVIGDQTVYPPDDTKVAAQTMTFIPGYIFYDYQDKNGSPRTLVYDVAGKGWSVDVTAPVANCHSLPVEVNQILLGCVDGSVRAFDTTGTETATAVLSTPCINTGESRAPKILGDVFYKATIFSGNPVAVALYQNRYSALVTGYAPTSLTGTGVLASYIVDITNGDGFPLIDVASELSWPVGSGNILEWWEPAWAEQLPDAINDRPTDWMDLGSAGSNYVRGLILEVNTFGAGKAMAVEDENGVLRVPVESPIFVDGQKKIGLAFRPPFVSHIGRIVSSDGVPWMRGPDAGWSVEWISDPYPEITPAYTPIMEIGGPDNKFVQGIKLTADTGTFVTTFQVLFDGGQTGPTFSGSFNGKQTLVFSWPPFQAHDLQLVPGGNARIWTDVSKWAYRPFAESQTLWQTEMISYGLAGWLHIPWLRFAYQSTTPVTLTLLTDQGQSIILTIPTGGAIPAKFFTWLPPNKFKLVSWQATSTAPFNVFEPDIEVAIGQWGRASSYQTIRPFGGPTAPGAEV